MKLSTQLTINKLPILELLIADWALGVAMAGAEATVTDAKRLVEGQAGSGRKYSALPNSSSAPGESPVNQSGALLDSIAVDPAPDQKGSVDAVAGTDVALFLELGTSRIAPRPFLGPATDVGQAAAVQANADLAARMDQL